MLPEQMECARWGVPRMVLEMAHKHTSGPRLADTQGISVPKGAVLCGAFSQTRAVRLAPGMTLLSYLPLLSQTKPGGHTHVLT